MNKVFISFEQNTKKFQWALLTCLVSLLLYGLYKNGFSYYFQGLITLQEASSLLVFPLISLACSFLYESIEKRRVHFSLSGAMEGILLCLLIHPRFPLWCYLILVVLYFLLKKFLASKLPTVSLICLIKVLSMLLSEFIFHIDYQNIVEVSYPYLYGILDAFFGRSVGALGTTSIFLILIYYGISCSNYYYKKELPIYILGSFFLLETIYVLLVSHDNLLLELLNSHVFFAAIVLAPMKNKSPAEAKGLVLYGIAIGIGCFLISNFANMTDGIYIVLLLAQIIWTIYLNIQTVKYQKTLVTQKD